MKTIINEHQVETIEVDHVLSLVSINGGEGHPNGATLEQILYPGGKVVLTGSAWDEEQKNLIQKVFPKLSCRKKSFGYGWDFRGEN